MSNNRMLDLGRGGAIRSAQGCLRLWEAVALRILFGNPRAEYLLSDDFAEICNFIGLNPRLICERLGVVAPLVDKPRLPAQRYVRY